MMTGCAQNSASTTSTATPSNQPIQGGKYIVLGQGDPYSFNPNMKVDDWGVIAYQNMFNRLVKQTVANDVVPDLAKSWQTSDDGLTLTFNLEENVTWHDGVAFSSEDVKWTFDKVRSEGYQSNNFKAVEDITCPDTNTVVFHLSRPDAGLISVIGWLGTFIMPKHIYENTDWATNEANFKPVGTGPFQFESYDKGVSIKMTRNENYFKGAPYLDEVIISIIPDSNTAFQSYLNGEIDDIQASTPFSEIKGLQANESFKTYEYVNTSRTYLSFNLKEGPFSDIRVRQAVELAVNRQEILDKAAKGIGQVPETYISPVFDWAINQEAMIPEMNKEKAMMLLEEAGYTKNAEGFYFTASLDTFSSNDFQDTAMVIQANLKEIGINVVVNVAEIASFQTKVLDDYDFDIAMCSGSQGPDISAISNRISETGSLNLSRYANREVETLLQEGLKASTQEARMGYYKEIQSILQRDLPMVIVKDTINIYPVKSFIQNHPYSTEMSHTLGTAEFSKIWIDQVQ